MVDDRHLQVPLGHVRGVVGSVDENVIPGSIAGRTRPRDLVVPLLGALVAGVHVDHDPAIVEAQVTHHLADSELRVATVLFYSEFTPNKIVATGDADARYVEVVLQAKQVNIIFTPVLSMVSGTPESAISISCTWGSLRRTGR